MDFVTHVGYILGGMVIGVGIGVGIAYVVLVWSWRRTW